VHKIIITLGWVALTTQWQAGSPPF